MSEEGTELREGRSNMSESARNCCPVAGWALGVVGAVGGGVLGYFLFMVIAKQGFYAIALPGALVGIGCRALSGRKSTGLGIVCAVLGLAAGMFSEWRFAPFIKDGSLGYFLTHFHETSGVTLVLVGIGAVCAFHFGRGRNGGAWLRQQKEST